MITLTKYLNPNKMCMYTKQYCYIADNRSTHLNFKKIICCLCDFMQVWRLQLLQEKLITSCFFSAMFAIFIPPEPNVKAFYGCIYIFKDDYVI